VTEDVFTFRFNNPDGERLDRFLVESLPGFSRTRLQALIRDGFVRVDGAPAKKSGQMLEPDMLVEVRVPPPAPTDLIGEDIPLDIVFENEDVIVVNKPAGMVVHPAAGHDSGTLVHAALGYDPDIEGIGGEGRPGVVHRLDKETSGLILLAKNDKAHRWLQDQFRLRKVEKIYLALVDGKPPTPFGRVEAAIGRDPNHRKKMAIVSVNKGREAISEYRTLESFPNHTLLEFHPLTGRTHQIRLHCAFLGCPIVGDEIYGRKKSSIPLGRHFLHAHKLKVVLPGEEQPRVFEAGLPDELSAILDQLRNTSHR
jgi:23S rRNA pseudouridine1911/1915/1917 synthase